VTTFPWHLVGILGMPRRMAYFDYSDPALAAQASLVTISAIGGLILVISVVLFFIVLLQGHRSAVQPAEDYRFSTPVHESPTLPVALNSFALWIVLMVALTVANYGYPIAQLLATPDTAVPAIPIGAPR
jgi:cytochrome c oxidase subunit 1